MTNRGRFWFVLAAVVLWLASLLLVGFATLGQHEQTSRNNEALTALCFQRADLDKRITTTGAVLNAHPHQKLIFGIPRALLISGLKQSIQTRQNLDILDCKEQR